MSCHNPTTPGSAVALTIPADHVTFLRSVFTMARDGIQDELARYPDDLREPKRLHREQVAYERLLTALDQLVIVPDYDIQAVLRDLAEVIDRGNEYGRVVAEHAALLGLCEQVCEGATR